MEKFVALDFETSNYNFSSICQIGIVCFENGNITNAISQLIDPEDYFEGYHVRIHNIKPEDVKGKPTFNEYYPELKTIIENNIIVHHQPFDKSAFDQVCVKYSIEPPLCYWVDNARIVRRIWPERSQKGYGLKDIANMLDITFNHHDALEDARTAGLIFLEACKIKGYCMDDMITNVYEKSRYNHSSSHPQKITGDVLKPDFNKVTDKENPFYGKKVVISGTYTQWPDRKILAELMKNLGADIDTTVTDKTDFLIAGEGAGPSKIQKMKRNIEKGKNAAILTEAMLLKILNG